MTLADRVMERFRKRLARWVEKERAAVGCADVAIKRVASKLGMSAMGVRRVLGRYGSVKVQAHHFVALLICTLKPKRQRMVMTILAREKQSEPAF